LQHRLPRSGLGRIIRDRVQLPVAYVQPPLLFAVQRTRSPPTEHRELIARFVNCAIPTHSSPTAATRAPVLSQVLQVVDVPRWWASMSQAIVA
jgi:hypothetical protein